MNTTPRSVSRCARCGTLLAAAVAQGLCPSCLTRSIFAEEPEPTGEEPWPEDRVRRIGDYELLELIARGGMGMVYRARQISLGREVALKVLPDSAFASPDELARFRAEAGTAAALQHPNIVAVHEVGESEGRRFFSMDFVAGKDLAALTRDGPLPARRAAALLVKIADAIQHTHEQGILHRDLKPSNVLVDAFGEPHVTDFGLAKRLRDSAVSTLHSPLTLTGQVIGTPGYMSPEQAAAKRDVGPAADIYSLGALLYHLVTARAPFIGDTPTAVLRQVEDAEPISVGLLNPSAPADLGTICLKCLAKEPQRRYASARELGQDLQRFLNSQPIRARPVGAAERTWRWCRRRPRLAALLAVSALLLIAVIGVTLYARVRLAADQRLLRHKDYVADLRLVDRAIEQNKLGEAAALLDKWRPAAGGKHFPWLSGPEEDLRGFEWRYFAGLCQGDELCVLGRHDNGAQLVAFSPDGQRVASTSLNGEVRLWDLASRRPLGEGRHTKRVRTLAFSTDDRFLATGGDDQFVRLWDAKTLQPIGAPLELNSTLVTLAFTPDGTELMTLARHEFVSWNLPQRVAKQRWPVSPSAWFYGSISPNLDALSLPMPGLAGVRLWNLPPTLERGAVGGLSLAVAFSADNRLLATGELSGQVRIWDLADLREVTSIATHGGDVRGLAWSPDGTRVATGGRDGLLRVWGIPSGKLLSTHRGHQASVSGIAFAPDGRQLVSASADGTVRLWDAMRSPTTREALSRKDWGLLGRRGAAWSILGRHGASSESDTDRIDPRRMELVPIAPPAELRSPSTVVRLIEDGLLVFGPGPEVRRFDAEWRLVAPVARLPQWPVSISVASPDGRWLCWRQGQEETALQGLWEIGPVVSPLLPGRAGTLWELTTFSDDSHHLADITIGGELSVWDLARKRLERRFQATRGTPTGLGFSPDNRRLAVSGDDSTVRVWNTGAWEKPPVVLSASPESVWCVGFSPDSRRVVGGGDDRNVFLWDLSTAQMICKFKAPGNGYIEAVGFWPESDALFASEHAWLYFWRASSAAKR